MVNFLEPSEFLLYCRIVDYAHIGNTACRFPVSPYLASVFAIFNLFTVTLSIYRLLFAHTAVSIELVSPFVSITNL